MVVNRLEKEGIELSGPDSTPGPSSSISDGVFNEIEDAIQAASIAQQKLRSLPLQTREQIIETIRTAGITNAEDYGRMEFEETGLGKLEDNIKKNQAACQVMGMEDLEPEVFSGDKGVTIIERIPVGVIASVNPVTNGAPTILFNAIMMLAGGNTVVNNPHPKTRIVSARVIRDLNQAIVGAGGPQNCVCCLEEPSVPSAQALMTHPKIRLIAVTGGHGVVAFATQTGKRLIAGGPGNPPVVVDETADLDRAAECIVEGASFSNCMACASEKEIFVVESVADQLKQQLKKQGAYEIDADQGENLLQHIFKEIKGPEEPGVINMDYIGKTPSIILQTIGLNVGSEAKIVILETGAHHPLVWTEQIMPVLPFVRCATAEEAIERAIAAEQGNGHTMAIHSNNLETIKKMASMAKCAAFVKNGSCGLASVGVAAEGYTSFHIATNGEGQTRPRMFTLIRRCVLADDFRFRYGG
jgi:propionaldehyde dehydrogenase